MNTLFNWKLLLVPVLLVILTAGSVSAEEVKMVGTVSKITMSADMKSAVVILKDTKSSEEVSIIVNDELTLDKFNDKRIVEGDEIRCKYDNETGKNVSKIFRKTAGC